MTAAKSPPGSISAGFDLAELGEGFEAAFVLKPTGVPVLGWTQRPVSHEIISVMAATMWGAVDVLVHALGGDGPLTVKLEADGRRVLARKMSRNGTLLLIVAHPAPWDRLEAVAMDLAERLREQGLLPPPDPDATE